MIITLIGPDTYRALKNLSQLKEKFRRDVDSGGINITELSGNEVTIENVRSAVLTQSFLVRKRLVVVKYPEEASKETQEALLEFFSSDQYPDDDVITIVLSRGSEKKNAFIDFLSKQKHAYRFDAPQGRDLEAWITKEAGGLRLDRQAIQHLILYCGSDTWRIASELKKLAAYCGERPATAQDVDLLVAATEEQNIFDLVDAVANRETSRAAQLLGRQIADGADPHYLFTMLARQIRIVSGVAALMTQGVQREQDIADELHLHPFVAKKAKQQAAKFSPTALAHAWDELVSLDLLLKRSRVTPEVAFQKFMLALA